MPKKIQVSRRVQVQRRQLLGADGSKRADGRDLPRVHVQLHGLERLVTEGVDRPEPGAESGEVRLRGRQAHDL